MWCQQERSLSREARTGGALSGKDGGWGGSVGFCRGAFPLPVPHSLHQPGQSHSDQCVVVAGECKRVECNFSFEIILIPLLYTYAFTAGI